MFCLPVFTGDPVFHGRGVTAGLESVCQMRIPLFKHLFPVGPVRIGPDPPCVNSGNLFFRVPEQLNEVTVHPDDVAFGVKDTDSHGQPFHNFIEFPPVFLKCFPGLFTFRDVADNREQYHPAFYVHRR